ncbi:MAG: DUF5071 domain-containing protein [Clostridia bacterium]
MIDIDYIMSLIDWNKSIDEQAEGIKIAEDIENINVFLQPCNKNYNKNVWDNCAKILSKRTDEELSPYLVELLEWLQDLNWPGAFCILDRLQKYADEPSYNLAFNTCLKYAKALDDDVWESNLEMLKRK